MREYSLTRYQRLIVAAIMCAPVVAMAIMGMAHLVHQTRLLLTDAQWILGDTLSQYFGREVHVGRARLAPLGSAVIEKLEIADGPTFANGKMVSVRRITIRYDVGGIILGGMGASGIQSVEVVDPQVRVVRKPDGSLNVMELGKPPVEPTGPPFKGRVAIMGGRISFVDRLSGNRGRPTVINLLGVNARFDGVRYPVWSFQLSAFGEPGRLAYVRGVGEFNQANSTLRMDTVVSGVSIPLVALLAGTADKVRVSAGTIDAAIGLTTRVPVSRIPSVTGVMWLKGVEAGIPGLGEPVKRVNGTVALLGDRAVLNLNGFVFGSRTAISGSVTGLDDPKVDLNVSLSTLDVNGVLRALGMAQRLPRGVRIGHMSGFSATFGGAPTAPIGQATMSLSRVSAFGYSARDVRLSVGYRSGEVVLNSLKFSVEGANVEACGRVGITGTRNVAIRGSIRGLSIGRLPLPPNVHASGVANADFVINGSVTRPRAFVRVAATRTSFGGFAIPAIFAELDLDVQSRRGVGIVALNTADGLIRIRGVGGPNRVDLAYSAEAIDLSEFGSLLKNVDMSGIVYVTGRVFGDPKNPVVTGGVEVFKGRYADTEFNYTRLAFSANKQKAVVKEGVVRLFPAELRFAGTAEGFTGDRIDFRGEAHVKRLQTGRLSELVGKEIDVTGTIAGDFEFSGAYMPYAKLKPGDSRVMGATVDGTLKLDDGLAYGFIINTAGAKVALRDNVLTLSDASVVSGDASIALSGTVNIESKQADIAFEVTGFDLARVRDRVENYLTIGGLASAKGTVTGPFDNLSVSASADVKNLTLNEVRFDQTSIEAFLSRDVVSSYRISLARDNQTFVLEGKDFDISTKHASSISGELSKVNMVDLWTMAVTSPYLASEKAKPVRDAIQRFPRLTGGEINGSFNLSGYFAVPEGMLDRSAVVDNLNGSVKMVASDVAFDSRQIESMSLDATLANGAVTLREAKMVAGDTFAALMPLMSGAPVYEKGNVALELVAANLDLARLQPWLGENTPTGNATANFTVSGDPRQPEIKGSIEVVNPGLHGAKFDSLRVSQIVVGADRIDISDVILSTGGHQAVAQGYIPWDWSTLNVPRDKPFEFTAGLLNENLALLNAFAQIVQPAPLTSGALIAEVKASGTVADPTLTGAIKVENGTLALRGFLSSFADVDVDISFDHKSIVFNKFSAQSTAGGTIFIEPGGKITLAGKNEGYGVIDLVLRTGGLVIEQKDVFGFQEKVKAQIDSGIAIGGTILSPLIADAPVPGYDPGITISNADFEFAIPEKKAPSPPLQLPIHPKFLDLGLTIGSNVHVRPPQMDLVVEGGGNMSRELGKDLYVSLGVTVKEGIINLFASRLRIEPGAEMVLRYQEPNLPEFVLTNFKATTSVTAVGPLGKRERYKVTIAAGGNVMNLSEKNFTFTSEPEGLTKEQILAALGHVQGLLNTTQGDFQREFANALKGVATSALLMPVERLFTERLGFEEFAVESGQFAPISLYLSRRLFSDFYLSFYQRLQATAGVQDTSWQLLFGYKFKRFYSISVGIDDQQTTTGELSFTKAISL